MDEPSTQRSWFITARGKPSKVLALKEDAPVPKPGKGEILVKVKSVSLNPIGYKLMTTVPWPMAKYPMVPEGDFSGIVVVGTGKEGSGSKNEFKQGDEVIGWFNAISQRLAKGRGAMAEYVVIPAEYCAHKPASLPFPEAAGIPTAGLTAWQGLIDHGHMQKGWRVFINGGSSSVGSIAIQIAKLHGAHVVTSCSGAKTDLVKSFGADEVLDYTQSPVWDQLAALPANDLIFDCIGTQNLYIHSPQYLKPDRQFISISLDTHGLSTWGTTKAYASLTTNFFCPKLLGGVPRKFKLISMVWNQVELTELAQLAGDGKVKIPIDSVYQSDYKDVMEAFKRQMSNRAKGKIIVAMS